MTLYPEITPRNIRETFPDCLCPRHLFKSYRDKRNVCETHRDLYSEMKYAVAVLDNKLRTNQKVTDYQLNLVQNTITDFKYSYAFILTFLGDNDWMTDRDKARYSNNYFPSSKKRKPYFIRNLYKLRCPIDHEADSAYLCMPSKKVKI